MKYLKYLLSGVFFGIILTKAEVVSWFRIHEMFHFESFHMYGIIGSAVVLGAITLALAKKYNWQTIEKKNFSPWEYARSWKRYIYGGIIFGMGWALIGACPGPMFILLGHGTTSIIVAILGALLGTFIYGLLSKKLPS